jgi:hypothetical protein
MKREFISAALLGAILSISQTGCGGSDDTERALPAMMKARFLTEMKTILHDLKAAQEIAAVSEGSYLDIDDLTRSYFNRPVPDTYTLTLSDLSADAFRAEIVHNASGLSCRLDVGTVSGQAGRGVPLCD